MNYLQAIDQAISSTHIPPALFSQPAFKPPKDSSMPIRYIKIASQNNRRARRAAKKHSS